MGGDRDRALWHVTMPPGGWGPPWPQAIELIEVLPGDQWTLIGGLMVQLHMAHAGLPMARATVDVDMVLHLETGATTFGEACAALEQLGYQIHIPVNYASPVHRFTRGLDQVDVMAADHLAPSRVPTIKGHKLFQVPAGTSALRKTVNCQIDRREDASVIFSIPDVLGALILKGAAYKADTRDRGRHLDDAALLCCALESPSEQAQRLQGSDRGRIRVLANELCDPAHRSWSLVPGDLRQFGIQALEVLKPLTHRRRRNPHVGLVTDAPGPADAAWRFRHCGLRHPLADPRSRPSCRRRSLPDQIRSAAAARGMLLQAYLLEAVHAQAAHVHRREALNRTAARLRPQRAVDEQDRQAVLEAIDDAHAERGFGSSDTSLS